ncbi:MAG: hypothetical protein SGJ21_07425 [Alphaproteobacteria bacterium]|nr:hypothetical protein [Alphaproteobacteria bacterium]
MIADYPHSEINVGLDAPRMPTVEPVAQQRPLLPPAVVAVLAQRPLVTAAVAVVAGVLVANAVSLMIGRARARSALGHSIEDHRRAREISRLPSAY